MRPEDPELARKRAEILERFLREKPWDKSLQERHRAYLALRQQDLPAEDLGEYTASLVTGLPHVGRQGYTGSDKPPFDLAAADGRLLVDAKVFDSGKSKAQHTLKVKRDRPGRQFRVWAESGVRAIPCQLARGRNGWFLVPGIPIKDVPLRKDVTADLDPAEPMKPVRLLDRADLAEWNDFQRLVDNWLDALAFLRKHEGEIMARVEQARRVFTDKEAGETLQDNFERPIWIAKAAEIPEAKQQFIEQVIKDKEGKQQIIEQVIQDKEGKQQVIEQVFQDEEAKQQLVQQVFQDEKLMREQLGEELFLQWKARQQARATPTPASPSPKAEEPPSPRKGRNGRKKS